MSLGSPTARLTDTQLGSFTDQFGARVCRKAAEQNWNRNARQLAHDYVVSLTKGSGDIPKDLLNPVILTAIHEAFTLTIGELGVPDKALPGQRRKLTVPKARGAKPARRRQQSARIPRQRVPHAA